MSRLITEYTDGSERLESLIHGELVKIYGEIQPPIPQTFRALVRESAIMLSENKRVFPTFAKNSKKKNTSLIFYKK